MTHRAMSTPTERGLALRLRCLEMFQAAVDACPRGYEPDIFGAARWEIGHRLFMDVLSLPTVDGFDYEYRPVGDSGHILGLPVKWVRGDGLRLVTGEIDREPWLR